MKNTVLLLFFLTMPLLSRGQTIRIDSVAILILDRMSSVIGDLNSCSFTLHTSNDVPDNTFFVPFEGLGLVKQFAVHEIYIVGPDKMLVNSNGEKGHWGTWYNGERITYYSFTENNFAFVPVSGNVVEAIDEINKKYGVEFPAADFFYPTLVDDLIEQMPQIVFLGTTEIMGKSCFHIIAANPDTSIQFWISNDALTLPVKMVVVSMNQESRPQYEATFTDWQLNPDLPPTLFEFMPPPNATEITLVPRPQNN